MATSSGLAPGRALSEALARGNPVVFFDVAIEGVPQGRIRMELFKKECPRTVENFRCVSVVVVRSFVP
jgi:peptidyl-prolyl isomerase H (cyclophilin H)